MSQTLDLRNPNHYELYSLHCVDEQYINLADAIIAEGTVESDPERTTDQWQTIIGVGFQLQNTSIAFPALLSARKNWYAAVDEMCWMGRGETNISSLNSKIWNEWADEDGECGPIYGLMWRMWPDIKTFPTVESMKEAQVSDAEIARIEREINRMKAAGYTETQMADGRVCYEGTVDQFADALRQIRARSRSRRIRVQAYNPGYLHMQGLPPCHTEFEFNVTKSTAYEQAQADARGFAVDQDSLHLSVHLRSNDVLLGRPFNIMGYTAMLHLIAKWAGLNIGSITVNSTNTHLYTHHIEAYKQQRAQWMTLREQMQKTGQPVTYPQLEIIDDIIGLEPEELLDNLSAEWFNLVDYSPLTAVKGRVTK